MLKNKCKILTRIFCVIICSLVLVFSVSPAFALSPNVQTEDSGTKVRPLVSGDFLIECDRSDVDPQFGYVAVQGSLGDWTFVTWDSYQTAAFSHVNGIIDDVYLYQDSQRVRTTVNGVEYFRINEKFTVVGDNGSPFIQRAWHFTLDDFGGSWDVDWLNQLFQIIGTYQFTINFTLWAIDNNGGIVSAEYDEGGTANGTQSVMYAARLKNCADSIGLTVGEPYFITDWVCTVEPMYDAQNRTSFEVSRAATAMGKLAVGGAPVSRWPFQYGSFQEFLRNAITGDVPDLEANSFSEWMAGVATSFFDTEIFGFFTLGDVALVVFAVGVVFWLLKLFAGG